MKSIYEYIKEGLLAGQDATLTKGDDIEKNVIALNWLNNIKTALWQHNGLKVNLSEIELGDKVHIPLLCTHFINGQMPDGHDIEIDSIDHLTLYTNKDNNSLGDIIDKLPKIKKCNEVHISLDHGIGRKIIDLSKLHEKVDITDIPLIIDLNKVSKIIFPKEKAKTIVLHSEPWINSRDYKTSSNEIKKAHGYYDKKFLNGITAKNLVIPDTYFADSPKLVGRGSGVNTKYIEKNDKG